MTLMTLKVLMMQLGILFYIECHKLGFDSFGEIAGRLLLCMVSFFLIEWALKR